jgi:hypothetical protein
MNLRLVIALAALTASAPLAAQAIPPLPPPPPPYPPREGPPPPDPLGDVWEMQEVSEWRGTWIRRGRTRFFDAYWTHPYGERVLATVEIIRNGGHIIVVRRHTQGRYCRYDGALSEDGRNISGTYTCTWARTPMPWQAHIVWMQEAEPQVLR